MPNAPGPMVHGFAAPDHPVALPAGRLLYRPIVEVRHVLVGYRVLGIWLTEEGWTRRSRGVGPLRPEQALRAVRLVNTTVPQGCELGPWQSGLELFASSPLPAHADAWERIDEGWLPPPSPGMCPPTWTGSSTKAIVPHQPIDRRWTSRLPTSPPWPKRETGSTRSGPRWRRPWGAFSCAPGTSTPRARSSGREAVTFTMTSRSSTSRRASSLLDVESVDSGDGCAGRHRG
jgi:hypothetical protein